MTNRWAPIPPVHLEKSYQQALLGKTYWQPANSKESKCPPVLRNLKQFDQCQSHIYGFQPEMAEDVLLDKCVTCHDGFRNSVFTYVQVNPFNVHSNGVQQSCFGHNWIRLNGRILYFALLI